MHKFLFLTDYNLHPPFTLADFLRNFSTSISQSIISQNRRSTFVSVVKTILMHLLVLCVVIRSNRSLLKFSQTKTLHVIFSPHCGFVHCINVLYHHFERLLLPRVCASVVVEYLQNVFLKLKTTTFLTHGNFILEFSIPSLISSFWASSGAERTVASNSGPLHPAFLTLKAGFH